MGSAFRVAGWTSNRETIETLPDVLTVFKFTRTLVLLCPLGLSSVVVLQILGIYIQPTASGLVEAVVKGAVCSLAARVELIGADHNFELRYLRSLGFLIITGLKVGRRLVKLHVVFITRELPMADGSLIFDVGLLVVLLVPAVDLARDLVQQSLVLLHVILGVSFGEAASFVATIVALLNGGEEHEAHYVTEFALGLHVGHLLLEGERDASLVYSGDPRVVEGVLERVALRRVTLGEPHKEVLGQPGQVRREGKFVRVRQAVLVGLGRVLVVVERVLASSQQHVHYDAHSPYVDGLRVLLLEGDLWRHEDQGATVLVQLHEARVPVLGREPEVAKLNRREVLRVAH